MIHRVFVALLANVILGSFLLFLSGSARAADIAIALAGDTAPDTGGGSYDFFFFGRPSINDQGEVALFGSVSGGSTTGIFVESETLSRKVALTGEVAPGSGGGTYSFFFGSPVEINNNGDVAFLASIVNGATASGIFVESGGTISPLVLAGDSAPGTGGGFLAGFIGMSLNESGQVAFIATVASSATSQGVFLVSPTTPVVAMVLKGDAAAGVAGSVYDSIRGVVLNDAGEVAILAGVDPFTDGYFVESLANPGRLIAFDGDPAPGTGGGSYDFFNVLRPAFNNSGDAAFLTPIAGGSGGDGVFADRGGVQAAVALEGDPAPGTGGGSFAAFDPFATIPAMNDSGSVVFPAGIVGGTTSIGIFVDAAGTLSAAAVAGGDAPDTGGGTYSGFTLNPDINAGGQTVFVAGVDGGTTAGGVFATPAPEPATSVTLLSGALLLAALRRSRR